MTIRGSRREAALATRELFDIADTPRLLSALEALLTDKEESPRLGAAMAYWKCAASRTRCR